jgi:hypothetical protein
VLLDQRVIVAQQWQVLLDQRVIVAQQVQQEPLELKEALAHQE